MVVCSDKSVTSNGERASAGMGGCIVGPLYKRQELEPLMWLIIDKRPEVLFQNPIKNFSLAIRFWVVCRAYFKFCTTHAKKLLPKFTDKYRITVRYKAPGKTMVFTNHVEE